jgi:hypothetical protein
MYNPTKPGWLQNDFQNIKEYDGVATSSSASNTVLRNKGVAITYEARDSMYRLNQTESAILL